MAITTGNMKSIGPLGRLLEQIDRLRFPAGKSNRVNLTTIDIGLLE